MKFNDELIQFLMQLMGVCQDAQEGYQAACELVEDVDLKRLFKQYSHQRSIFVKELESSIKSFGALIKKDRSAAVPKPFRRGWMTRRSFMKNSTDTEIIIECERGEEKAFQVYDKVLQADWPSRVRKTIEHQSAEIHKIYHRVRALEKSNLF